MVVGASEGFIAGFVYGWGRGAGTGRAVALPAAEIKKRLATWKAPRPRSTTGVFAKYARVVSDASEVAVTS